MMKRTMLALGMAICMAGCQNDTKKMGGQDSPNVSAQDNAFFRDTAAANMTEIQLSQAALNQSQNASVKQFAQRMIDDHTAAENQLSTLATSKGAAAPTKLDEMHMKMVSDLQASSGKAFDTMYVDDQIAAHKEAIKNVQHEADEGSDMDSKNMAMTLLPQLKEHLQMAEQLKSNMGGM